MKYFNLMMILKIQFDMIRYIFMLFFNLIHFYSTFLNLFSWFNYQPNEGNFTREKQLYLNIKVTYEILQFKLKELTLQFLTDFFLNYFFNFNFIYIYFSLISYSFQIYKNISYWVEIIMMNIILYFHQMK